MILRLAHNLAKKIKETDLPVLPSDPNPYADWAARLFAADRSQYILITNSVSLYSVVIYGRGVADGNALIDKMMDMLRDVMDADGNRLLYEKQIAPQHASVSFSKAVARSVTGSMNDLVIQAKAHLVRNEISSYDLSFRLNEVPMAYLNHRHPRDAFQSMNRRN